MRRLSPGVGRMPARTVRLVQTPVLLCSALVTPSCPSGATLSYPWLGHSFASGLPGVELASRQCDVRVPRRPYGGICRASIGLVRCNLPVLTIYPWWHQAHANSPCSGSVFYGSANIPQATTGEDRLAGLSRSSPRGRLSRLTR